MPFCGSQESVTISPLLFVQFQLHYTNGALLRDREARIPPHPFSTLQSFCTHILQVFDHVKLIHYLHPSKNTSLGDIIFDYSHPIWNALQIFSLLSNKVVLIIIAVVVDAVTIVHVNIGNNRIIISQYIDSSVCVFPPRKTPWNVTITIYFTQSS